MVKGRRYTCKSVKIAVLQVYAGKRMSKVVCIGGE